MGLFSSLIRFFSFAKGQAEGGVERATDSLLASSPDAIRNQFRKTREDWIKDHKEMKEAVAQLVQIRDGKLDEIKKLVELNGQVSVKMEGAIALYRQDPQPAYKEEYSKLACVKEESESKIETLTNEIDEQNKVIDNFKMKIADLKQSIENLKKEEAETVADIVSAKKITQLNDKLQGMSQKYEDKNIEAIRSARKQLLSEVKLDAEMSGSSDLQMEKKLLFSGKISKHMDEFEKQVKLDAIFASPQEPKRIEGKSSENKNTAAIDALF